MNVRIGDFIVDFLWREERLIVETDGYAAHRGRQAFEDDHTRELALHADGYRPRRFTDRQVRRQPDAVAAVVARALNSTRLDPPRAIACARWGGGIAVVP